MWKTQASVFIKECFVEDFYKFENWAGEEVTFSAFVLEKDVVNIKITYQFLDERDYFTIFNLSPSQEYSRRTETKNEIRHHFPVKTINKANDCVEFKISAEKGTIEVFYEPSTHEQISINQTPPIFKDLVIRARNTSLCKNVTESEIIQKNVPDTSTVSHMYLISPPHEKELILARKKANISLELEERSETSIVLSLYVETRRNVPTITLAERFTTKDLQLPQGKYMMIISYQVINNIHSISVNIISKTVIWDKWTGNISADDHVFHSIRINTQGPDNITDRSVLSYSHIENDYVWKVWFILCINIWNFLIAITLTAFLWIARHNFKMLNIRMKINKVLHEMPRPKSYHIYEEINEELFTVMRQAEEHFGQHQMAGPTTEKVSDDEGEIYSECEDEYDNEMVEVRHQAIRIQDLYNRFRDLKNVMDDLIINSTKNTENI